MFAAGKSGMKTQSTLQRTLQALFKTGIFPIFALATACAEDTVEVTANAAD